MLGALAEGKEKRRPGEGRRGRLSQNHSLRHGLVAENEISNFPVWVVFGQRPPSSRVLEVPERANEISSPPHENEGPVLVQITAPVPR